MFQVSPADRDVILVLGVAVFVLWAIVDIGVKFGMQRNAPKGNKSPAAAQGTAQAAAPPPPPKPKPLSKQEQEMLRRLQERQSASDQSVRSEAAARIAAAVGTSPIPAEVAAALDGSAVRPDASPAPPGTGVDVPPNAKCPKCKGTNLVQRAPTKVTKNNRPLYYLRCQDCGKDTVCFG